MARGDPNWQTSSTSPMSMPSSSDAVATRTFSSPFFSRCSALCRNSFAMLPVMRHHVLRADQFGQMTRRALRHPARVHENERRAVILCELRELCLDLLPDFMRHDRFERR
jgi:hypothetical protein